MQSMWLCIFSYRPFQETYENTQKRKASAPAGPHLAPPPTTAPVLPPPPLPPNPVPTRRLVMVIRRRANTWTSFNQLDGATEETPPSPLQPLSHLPDPPQPPSSPSRPPPSKPSPSPPVVLKKPVRMLNGDPVWRKKKWWICIFFISLSRVFRAALPNPTPRNALSVRWSVGHVFYPHLTRTHTNLICERTH